MTDISATAKIADEAPSNASWGTLNMVTGEERRGIGQPADGFTVVSKPPFDGRRLPAGSAPSPEPA